MSWKEVEEAASGQEVRMFLWGGDEGINRYIDEFMKPRLEKRGITIKRIPMDTPEILQKLQTEKEAGKKAGTIDLVWINGENFALAKEDELLYGPFLESLPVYESNYASSKDQFSIDFGQTIDGLEAPWGKVQFVFQYDEKNVQRPPVSLEELDQWIKENPGKFTFPDPSDFTGNAFLRHLLYDAVGLEKLQNGNPEEVIEEAWPIMMERLEEWKPNLWRKGETYPTSLEELDRLYAQGEVWMSMGYNEARAEHFMEKGIFPETTKTFVLEEGSIGNHHYLAIPVNSPNIPASLVAINEFLSVDAQLEKLRPTYWGENTPLNVESLKPEEKSELESISRGKSVLPAEELEEVFQPEVDAAYVTLIEEKWNNERK